MSVQRASHIDLYCVGAPGLVTQNVLIPIPGVHCNTRNRVNIRMRDQTGTRNRQRNLFRTLAACFLGLVVIVKPGSTRAAETNAEPFTFSKTDSGLWRGAVGDGLREGAHELDFVAGAGMGVRILETRAHDWGFGALDYGWVFTDVVADNHWFRGNWELIGEVFGGEQFRPEAAYFVGGGPHLRYDFATGHRWMPFLDLGAGATATDIRDGDISTTFEFNLQAGAGAHFFLRDNLALTVQARFIHFSNAGIKFPNLGVNALTGLVGISWFF
jgi:lipid A 3-O-deacylase